MKHIAFHLGCAISQPESVTYVAQGHDFRPKYKQLGVIKKRFPKVPVLAATATAKAEVQEDVIKSLGLPNPVTLRLSCDRDNLFYDGTVCRFVPCLTNQSS